MDLERRELGVRQRLARRKHRGQQRGHRRHRQHQRLQAVEPVEEIAEPVDQHREPEYRRDRVADAEMQAVGRERGAREQRGVQGERQEHG